MIQEITAKTIITRTKIPVAKYVINPYIGCTFGCLYCYARFIGPFKYTNSQWGRDVWVKVNSAELVERELPRTAGDFFLSSICDPYQHVEKKYGLTRKIIETLTSHFREVHLMTKSNLILRDIDLLKNISVTLTITTDREEVRKVLEPGAPSIEERIQTLRKLKESGIDVSVFIGPVLVMDAENFARMLSRYVEKVVLDGLNYHRQVYSVYKRYGWTEWLTKEKFMEVIERFEKVFGKGQVIY